MTIDPKMVIVIRKDLNMRKGKMISQGCHAALKVFTDNSHIIVNDLGQYPNTFIVAPVDRATTIWLNGIYTKICVGVDSEAELLSIYQHAKAKGLPCSLVQDIGLTEFDGVPTYTAAAVGPAYPEALESITGHLKLL